MHRLVPKLIAALAITLLLPATAPAQDNSAIDEYIEALPGAGGDRDGSDQARNSSDNGGARLPASAADALEGEGPSGAAAAEVAQATAPEPSGKRRHAASRALEPDHEPADGSPSVGRVVGGTLSGSSSNGLGGVLPIILVIIPVAALALALVRRRRDNGDTADT